MNYLDNLKKKPASHRHHLAVVSTTVGAVLVIAMWSMVIPHELGVKKVVEKSKGPTEFRPFALLKDTVKNSYTQIVGGAANADVLKSRTQSQGDDGLLVVPNPAKDVAGAEIHTSGVAQ